jgi:hypothetical protein
MQMNEFIRQWNVGADDDFTTHKRSCHAERSEASLGPSRETLRCAQGDSVGVDLSALGRRSDIPNNLFLCIIASKSLEEA